MNPQQQAQKLAEMYTDIAENEGAYFERSDWGTEWKKSKDCPSLNIDMECWRVHVPPKKQVIDLSVLIESQIDCEFSDRGQQWHVDKLKEIEYGEVEPYVNAEATYMKCRPRMNHLHAWQGGDCPLAEGLNVRLWLRNGHTFETLHCEERDWVSKGHDSIIAFEILGLSENWQWPWDAD